MRHKMSKRSEYRVKRNQQLMEAQRLLESHGIESKPGGKSLDPNGIIDHSSGNIAHSDFNAKERSKNRRSTEELPCDNHHPRAKSTNHEPFISNTEGDVFGKLRSLEIRNTSESGKLEQLKQRMEARRQKRRQQLMKANFTVDAKTPSQETSSSMQFNSDRNTMYVRNKKGNTEHPSNSEIEEICSLIEEEEQSAEPYQSGHDDDSVVSIELIYCQHCKKSYAPERSKKFCQTLDEEGNPKCLALLNKKKRKVYNSAKIRIVNNTHLQPEEQKMVISGRKKVVADLRQKASGKRSSKRSDKWKKESEDFRDAMKCNRLIAKAENEGKPAHYYL